MELRWLFLTLLGWTRASSPSLYGEITSPNYPQGYPSNANETWHIQVPEGYKIHLYFKHLDIESSEHCEYDHVQVIIGDKVQQTICGRHVVDSSGNLIEDKYYPTTELKLVFESDFSNPERYTGFAAYYTAVDIDECEEGLSDPCSHFCNNYIGGYFCSCPLEYDLQADQHTCGVNCSGSVYTELRGKISSPGYPAPYPENSRCEYKVRLEPGYGVILTFQATDFDIEVGNDGSCSYDSLTIIAKGGKKFGPFCGKVPPPPIRTDSNEVDILFHSDSGGDQKGWKIQYSEEAIPCPTQVTENSFLDPQQDRYVFKDTVTVSCEKGFEILVGQKKLLSFQAKCQSDGTWTNGHLKCQAVDCGEPDSIENGKVEMTDTLYESNIKYKCNTEYYTLSGHDSFSCSVKGLWVNSNGESELPKCVPVCGISSLAQLSRIFGGSKAGEGNFPWLVNIGGISKGVGAFISDSWILTAAHVLQNNLHPIVHVGSLKVKGGMELTVKKVILHPKYVVEDLQYKKNYDNDIALIQLSNKVEFGSCINPICLIRTSPAINEIGYIAGWGRTEKRDEAYNLQYAQVNRRNTDECKKNIVKDKDKDYVITPNMICAGGSGVDSCVGDSGGPLMFSHQTEENRDKLYVAGIVSWGVECGKFGMYTKVENYLDWIKETTEEAEKEEEAPVEIVNICHKIKNGK